MSSGVHTAHLTKMTRVQ